MTILEVQRLPISKMLQKKARYCIGLKTWPSYISIEKTKKLSLMTSTMTVRVIVIMMKVGKVLASYQVILQMDCAYVRKKARIGKTR